jgi:hypothetical protein
MHIKIFWPPPDLLHLLEPSNEPNASWDPENRLFKDSKLGLITGQAPRDTIGGLLFKISSQSVKN